MKVVIPGGSGQVGTILARSLHAKGHEVVVLSRSATKTPWLTRTMRWEEDDWHGEIDGADVVINLAGRTVNARYSKKVREEILHSRVSAVRAVGAAIAAAACPPAVWLQSSTATIYAHRYDAPNNEATGILGGSELDVPEKWHFSIDVAKAWERATDEALTPKTRKIKMRSAMTMSPDRGGIFDTLLRHVRFGLGGRMGDGTQFVSWVHEEDFVRAVFWLIEHEEVEGSVNIASPYPIPYAEFIETLRNEWGIPFGLPASRWMVEAGAFFIRSEAELVLKSRRVVPDRLLGAGFRFNYPRWPEAAADLVRRVKSR